MSQRPGSAREVSPKLDSEDSDLSVSEPDYSSHGGMNEDTEVFSSSEEVLGHHLLHRRDSRPDPLAGLREKVREASQERRAPRSVGSPVWAGGSVLALGGLWVLLLSAGLWMAGARLPI